MKTIKTSLTLSQAKNYQLLEIMLLKTPIIYPSLRATSFKIWTFWRTLKRLERIFLKKLFT